MKSIIFCVSCALFSMAWVTFCDMSLWLKCVLYFVNGCTLFFSGINFGGWNNKRMENKLRQKVEWIHLKIVSRGF